MGSNLLLKDGKLTVNLQKQLTCIKSAVPEIKAIHNRLEPLKIGFNKRKMGVLYSQSSMLLPQLDAFRTVDWKQTAEDLKLLIIGFKALSRKLQITF